MLDALLLALKILILVLLYLFIWRVARAAVRDLGAAQPTADLSPAVPVAFPAEAAVAAPSGSRQPVPVAGPSPPAAARPRLVVERSPVLAPGAELAAPGWLTLGRSPASDVVLDDSFVSGTHARVLLRQGASLVEDLGSTNGTFVNEKQVDEAELRPHVRLRVGETVFRYEE